MPVALDTRDYNSDWRPALKTKNTTPRPSSARQGLKAERIRGKGFGFAASTLILAIVLAVVSAPQDLRGDTKESNMLSLMKFGTGMITAYALHETGHALAASLTGTDIDWGVGTYNQPLGFRDYAENDTAGMILHASGLVTQVFSSEVILQAESIDKNDSFVRGMMAWNIINPILYALDYWVIRRSNKEDGNTYQGDLEGFENYSNEATANIFAAAMAGLAAYQGYRYVKTQTWAPSWMKQERVDLTYRLREDRGFELGVRVAF